MEKVILASSSPRRIEILKKIFSNFEIIIPNINESIDEDNPEKLVEKLSFLKAKSINKNGIIIAADTVVAYNGKILNKPKSEEEAIKTLKLLSGNKHNVYTGVCVIKNNEVINFSDKSTVYFRELSDEEIMKYVISGKAMDKAGSYGIQETDFAIKIEGDYYNIMGLPLEKLKELF